MKPIVFFVLTAILLPGMVFGQSNSTNISISIPNISGLTAPRAQLGVGNGTPFQAEVIAMNCNLGLIASGQSLYDQEPASFEGAPLPVLALIHDWDGKFLGIAKRTLRLSAGQADVWTIRLNEIIWVDGSYRQSFAAQNPYPAREVDNLLSREIDFPRPYWASTTMVQFGNATLFTLVIKLNDVEVKRLESGDIWYLDFKGWTTAPQQTFSVKAIYFDRGRYIGESSVQYFSTAHGQPVAHQFVYGPYDRQQY